MQYVISVDTIKIKINENGFLLSVTHVDNLRNYFPDADLSLMFMLNKWVSFCTL